MRRLLTATALAVCLVMLLAMPALAAVYEFGWKSCGSTLVGIRSYSTQTTTHFVLSPSYYETGDWNNGSTWRVRTSTTNHKNSVNWGVEVVGGSLNDPGTYAYCTSIS